LRVLQGNVTHYVIPLDDLAGTSNRPQYLTTRFHNGASCVPGRVNAALRLESSRQYVTIDEPQPSCFNNLELCNIGLCISFYLEISGTVPDVRLLKTDAYSVRMLCDNFCLLPLARQLWGAKRVLLSVKSVCLCVCLSVCTKLTIYWSEI